MQTKYRVPSVVAVLVLLLTSMAPVITVAPGIKSVAAVPPWEEIDRLQSRPLLPVQEIVDQHADSGSDDHEQGTQDCDKDLNRIGRASGSRFVAAVNTGVCQNTDIDVYSRGDKHYVVQGSKDGVAYMQTDVSNPARPVLIRRYKWAGNAAAATRTQDIATFRQGDKDYLAVSLERYNSSGYCGVVIVEITDTATPVVRSQTSGSNWCDSHTLFVEDDLRGDGMFMYVTANAPDDMRVLDISGKHGGSVRKPLEIGRYRAPNAGGSNYVHDITVVDHGGKVGRRVYVAYWAAGVVILDADDVSPGYNPRPLVGPNVIDPPGLNMHHAYPNASGDLLVVQSEYEYAAGDRPVQLWNISGIPSARPRPLEGLAPGVGANGELVPAHNLLVEGNRLYVGWFKAGMQVFTFGKGGFARRVAYHQVQTEAADHKNDGAWGVQLLTIGGARYAFQTDRHFGLIISRLDTTAPAVIAPVVRFVGGKTIGTQTAPARITWSATDDMSGVYSYRVQESVDNAPFTALSLPSAITRSVDRALTTGKTYRYRVRADDRSGNISKWVYGPAFSPARHQETNSAITYSGAWTREAVSGASGGYVKYATEGGAAASFSFTGRSVAWVALPGGDRGEARVYLDGSLAGTVDLRSETTLPRKIVFSRTWTTSGAHTLEIKLAGTSGRPRVDVDAFVTLR